MAVIINEFEIVSEPAPAAPAGEKASGAASGPTPEEVEAMLVRMAERVSRLRVY